MTRIKLILITLIVAIYATNDVNSGNTVAYFNGDEITACEVIGNLPYEELNNNEKSALLLMLEEEKLARDVYIAMAEKYDSRVFKNISEAENRHMEAIIIRRPPESAFPSIPSSGTAASTRRLGC